MVVLSKDKAYLYDLGGMTFMHRLNLDYHLGRVTMAANVSGERPLMFYSNSAEVGTLKVFDIEQRKVTKTLQCHQTTILRFACDLDGRFIVTCSTHGESIRLWDVDKGERIASYLISGGLEINGLFFAQTGVITILTRTDESQNRATLSLFKAPKEIKQALIGITGETIERLSQTVPETHN